jgi:hypothetical protein
MAIGNQLLHSHAVYNGAVMRFVKRANKAIDKDKLFNAIKARRLKAK